MLSTGVVETEPQRFRIAFSLFIFFWRYLMRARFGQSQLVIVYFSFSRPCFSFLEKSVFPIYYFFSFFIIFFSGRRKVFIWVCLIRIVPFVNDVRALCFHGRLVSRKLFQFYDAIRVNDEANRQPISSSSVHSSIIEISETGRKRFAEIMLNASRCQINWLDFAQ